MKKVILFLILLFASTVFSQHKWLSYADPILSRSSTTLPATFTIVTVFDTADTYSDTLVVEYYNANDGLWYVLGTKDYITQEWNIDGEMIPGDGESKVYLVAYPTPSYLRVRKTNGSGANEPSNVTLSTL